MIKNIIFDLGEVLFKGIKDTGLALQEKHKIEDLYNHELGWARAKHPLLIPLVEEFFLGKVTEDEYIQDVLNQYPQIGQKKDLKEQIRRNFIEIEGTRETWI
ncbi:MAG TPA: hypothetical protein VEC13_02945 [Candidatus Paceibacterota bacterium]|nr:hypothetical protein [Candidatus Paceibacterota bacterium]